MRVALIGMSPAKLAATTMAPLEGKRIGILEGRRPGQVAELVVRQGGVPTFAPALREVRSTGDASRVVDALVGGRYGLVVVLTAAGLTALIEDAAAGNRDRLLIEALRRTPIACRGPKPLTVLRQHQLVATIVTERPHTTRELLEALGDFPLDARSVLLIHYGERNDDFAGALASRGAEVDGVCLYEWKLPEDVEPLKQLVRDAIDGRIDAFLFTSQVQFRHLMQIAEEVNASASLVDALNTRVIVAAVGPVCAAALRAGGVIADVMPPLPNTASLVRALGDYFDLTKGADADA